MGRREDLADAGIRLTARGGARALTHRAVDAEAGVPAGSTSYYASTRRELTALVVARITEQLSTDLSGLRLTQALDDATVVEVAATFLQGLADRADAQAARLALLLELRDDDSLRAPLTDADPVRTALLATAEDLLGQIGVEAPRRSAVDLVGLVDALLLYRVAGVAPVDARAVLRVYVAGLPRS
jgi:AcrR family transcriptional regulator